MDIVLFFQFLLHFATCLSNIRKGCLDNGSTEGLWGIIKTEMYKMYEIYDKESLIEAIGNYINFYNYQRYQERYNSKAPMEIRMEAMNTVKPKQYPIAFNPRIAKYHELLNQSE